MLRAVASSFLSLIYPHYCRVCHELVDAPRSGTFCEKCWDEARLFTGAEMLCSKCGALLGDRAAVGPVSCGKCGDWKFDRAASLGVYEGALAAAVIELKTTPRLDLPIQQQIADSAALQTICFEADLLVPVPLSPLRRAERGFNQAEVIAAHIAGVAGISVDSLSLVRARHTAMHRMGMDSRAREIASVKAFRVTRENLVHGRRILLVDDVLTSGATASACSDALKKSGAAEVNVFTLARAVMH